MFGSCNIQQSPHRCRDGKAAHWANICFSKTVPPQNDNIRYCVETAKLSGNRHVQLCGHEIAKIIYSKCRIMRVNSLWFFVPVSSSEIPEDELCILIVMRKHRQARDSSHCANPVTHAPVV